MARAYPGRSSIRRAVRRRIRKSPLTYVIPVLFLILGLALGYFVTPALAGENSGMALVGEKTVSVPLGESYAYRDEGVSFSYFGIDCSSYVAISTNMIKKADGTYGIDTAEPGVYYIAYTSTHPLFERDVRLVRTFSVGGES